MRSVIIEAFAKHLTELLAAYASLSAQAVDHLPIVRTPAGT
jgi:hypothetical protein